LRFYDIEKSSPYECGFMPFDLIQRPFDVRFYRVAIVFMLFDVEVIFLFPWVVIAWEVETFGFVVFFFFIFILTVGFFYEWITGVLDVL
jgi:NADH-quinone oxidoreductase subunit A